MKKILTTTKKSVWGRAVERYKESTKPSRIGFLVDATGSRNKTWERAQGIQSKMFRAAYGIKAIKLRLVHFGGGSLTTRNWDDDTKSVAANMAAVRCQAGLTQILEGLQSFIDETPEDRATAIILIGDYFEECSTQAKITAVRLKDMGIKVYSFIEGNDHTAQTVFRNLAEISGGKFARFGDDLPLADLCQGVALLASGGKKALRQLGNKKVQRLLLGPAKV
jgi:hypothetical protein